MTLYEIDAAILALANEDGEITDYEALDALTMEREQKIENVACWIKDLKAEAEAVKTEADKLNTRKKAIDNKIDSLKQWLLYALDGAKLKTARCNVYQTHSQKLSVPDEPGLIRFLQTLNEPEKFLRIKEPELKKDDIKKALKDGYEIPGAALEETEGLVIR